MAELTFHSPHRLLNEGFERAKSLALKHVQTGKPRCSIPCYWAGLLDRRHICIRDFAHQAPGAHLLGLQRENESMLHAFCATATEARQWYPIWILGFDGTPFFMDYHHDRDFVREIPMVFELVETGYQLYRWTGRRHFIDHPLLWDYYTHAVNDFLAAHNPWHDGIAAEQSETGWPYCGISTYVECGESLRQAADALASQYQALLAYAAMQLLRQDAPGAAATRARAEKIKRHFQTHWWSDAHQTYAHGIGPTGQPVVGWSELSTIYMPLKGITEPGPRTEGVLDIIEHNCACRELIGQEMSSYVAETFFAHNRDDLACKRMLNMMALDTEYPEVPYTNVSNVVTGLLGVAPDAANSTVTTRSHLTPDLPWCEARHVRIGDHLFDIRHDARNHSTLHHRSGPRPLLWHAHFDGPGRSAPQTVPVGQTATARPV